MKNKAISGIVNPACHLRSIANDCPDRTVFAYSPHGLMGAQNLFGSQNYHYQSFGEFEAKSNKYANVFVKQGIGRGTKTILMAKSGPDLYGILYALFKIGAVPVLIDPGMGMGRMLHCLGSTGSEAFIGIPLAHAIRGLSSRNFSLSRPPCPVK